MSLYIKGLDMPKDVNSIDISIQDSGAVFVKSSEGYYEYKGNKAVEIPTPHGDLIDRNTVRDECYKTMEELMQSTTINLSAEALSLLCGFTIINNVPTIIEGED